MKLYGIVGEHSTDRTDLLHNLVAEISGRGLRVSTIKQAAPVFDVDQHGKDSYRHRTAGAREVILASRKRFALMHELRDGDEAALPDLLKKLAPVDLVLVEGYESHAHPKIEVHRASKAEPMSAETDDTVRAVATDGELRFAGAIFDLNDTAAIADFILGEVGLS